MKKIKKIYILILLFLMFILKTNISSAEAMLVISSDKTKVEVGEEINVSIKLKSVKVASFTLEIYWDTTRLEYISGPQNSNNLSNRILYSWISDNGENKDNILIDGFAGYFSGSNLLKKSIVLCIIKESRLLQGTI